MESNIDISKYMKHKNKKGKLREQARIAFKRWKNGMSISDYELKLIERWYPFLKGFSSSD